MLEYYWWKAINVRYINVQVLHTTMSHTSHLVHIVRVTNISEYKFSPIKLWNSIAILFIHEIFIWLNLMVWSDFSCILHFNENESNRERKTEATVANATELRDELYEFDPFFQAIPMSTHIQMVFKWLPDNCSAKMR